MLKFRKQNEKISGDQMKASNLACNYVFYWSKNMLLHDYGFNNHYFYGYIHSKPANLDF